MGRSILFSDTNENWRQRRKAMTPAFYKERLRGIVKLAAATVKNSIKRMKVDKERTFDIMEEILKTASEIILSCSMGEDSSTCEIDFWEMVSVAKETLLLLSGTLPHDILSEL